MQTLYQNNDIRIRPYYEVEAQQIYTAVSASLLELQLFMLWVTENYTLIDTKAWLQKSVVSWQQGTWYGFVIEDVKTGLFLGDVGLKVIDRLHQQAILGYWIHSEFTGRGIAIMAIKLLMEFAKEQLQLKKFKVEIAANNVKIIALIQKFSVRLCNIKANTEYIAEQMLDYNIYQLDL